MAKKDKNKNVVISAQSLDAISFNLSLLIGLLAEVHGYTLTMDKDSRYIWVPTPHEVQPIEEVE